MPATAMHHQRDQDRKGSPSPSQTIRTQKSFKRRFAFDDGDEDAEIVQHRSPKRRDNKEFVPFDPFRRVRQDASVLYSAQSHDRYRRQQSPTPEPPLIRELEGMFAFDYCP